MTYIKWQDELEKHLATLPAEEREKAFAEYSQKYAQKRAEGMSEAEAVDSFGAPYDVAQQILASAKPAVPVPAPQPVPATQNGNAPIKKSRLKGWHIALIIVGTVLFLWLLLFLVELGLNDWTTKIEYEMKTFTSQQDDSLLELNLSGGAMNVEFYDGDEIVIEYPASAARGYKVNEYRGKVVLDHRSTYSLFFNSWKNMPAINVKIPEDKVLDLYVDVSAGTAYIPSGEFGEVELELSAGHLSVGNISCRQLKIDVSAGDLSVDGVTCNNLETDLSAGSAKVNYIVCDNIEVDVSAGTARLFVCGDKNAYTAKVKKSAGSCNLVSNTRGTDPLKYIEVDVSSGTVIFEFINGNG